MRIHHNIFGNVEGEQVTLYTLENGAGMQLKIMNYGATVTSISIPGEDGRRVELACGFDHLEDYFSEVYRSNAPFFGCTVGRYSSRIKDGRFSVSGQAYEVACNDGPNHLHGGIRGFDKRIWTATPIQDQDKIGVEMKLSSLHLEEGYPGNVDITVHFSLNANNEFTIRYSAVTDQETPLSLTNHTYFNLSGFEQNILGHEAEVWASRHLKPDATNVPVGEFEALDGLPADLRGGALLQDAIAKMETGFEHYFLFDKPLWKLDRVATFKDAARDRTLEVSTTEPGMLFYTGYFTSDALGRNETERYGRFRGFCCETHRYPNGPNIPGSPRSLLKPDERYDSTTIYKLTF